MESIPAITEGEKRWEESCRFYFEKSLLEARERRKWFKKFCEQQAELAVTRRRLLEVTYELERLRAEKPA